MKQQDLKRSAVPSRTKRAGDGSYKARHYHQGSNGFTACHPPDCNFIRTHATVPLLHIYPQVRQLANSSFLTFSWTGSRVLLSQGKLHYNHNGLGYQTRKFFLGSSVHWIFRPLRHPSCLLEEPFPIREVQMAPTMTGIPPIPLIMTKFLSIGQAGNLI